MANLTDRQTGILGEIARADGYITFSALAKPFDVSSRTVIRELEACETWLSAYGVTLERKAGQGIRLVGGNAERKALLLQLNPNQAYQVFSTPDRQIFLRQKLLRSDEPIKLFTLGRQLKVAESTISGDLSRLVSWFSAYGLDLVRKPGLGIYLEGSGTQRRSALNDLLHEVWNENSLIELMLHAHESSLDKRIRALLAMDDQDMDRLRHMIQIVEVWEKQNQLPHQERNFLNLVLQLVTVSWRPLTPDEGPSADAISINALALSNSLMEEIALTLGMPWLNREVLPIARVLPILYPVILAGETTTPERMPIDSAELARRMISLIQGETGYAIRDEDGLVDALANHLQLAMTRLQFNQMIHNPLEKEIRDHYPQWFELARKCAALIEQPFNLTVPDAEIAYLTLYLGAVMEKAAARSEKRHRVAVLCPIGMSSSVLLASRVEALFPQVSVEAIISFKQAPEIILQQRFDLILSTADIVLPGIPVLTVRPFFPVSDQEKLRQFLKTLVPRRITLPAPESQDLLTQLSQLNDLVNGLSSLLNHFFCLDVDCQDLDQAIAAAAGQIRPDDPLPLINALQARESLGHVVLGDLNMALLHTRTAQTSDLHFGLLRLSTPMELEHHPVTTMLVMAAPVAVSPIRLDIMRLISRSIIDDEPFSQSLRRDPAAEVYKQLEKLLKDNFPLNLNDRREHR